MIISRSVPLRMKNISDANFRQKLEHTLCNNFPPRKSYRLWDNVEKCGAARESTDDYNKVHAVCMLDNQGYRHTFKIRNTCCFSTATMDERTLLNVTLYVHCLSCINVDTYTQVLLVSHEIYTNITAY